MPSMNICCGHPDWGAGVDRNYGVERRESGNDNSTKELIKQMITTDRLAGIFTGHWHQSRSCSTGDKKQCVAGAAFNGQYRMLHFIPSDTLG